MAWTVGEKKNPRLEGRVFKVDVEFLKDGVFDHSETYETTQDQPATWPGDGVKQHLQNLQAMDGMLAKITAGAVTLPADPVVDAQAEEWREKYRQVVEYDRAAKLGIVPANPAKFTNLVNTLSGVPTAKKLEYLKLEALV